MSNNITIITDAIGKKIVLINDLRFKGKTKEEWNEIEIFLKEYIGKYYEILETSEKVYIGTDFPDEVATNKAVSEDFGNKHKSKAQQGWYRYDTRFGIPTYNSDGVLQQYNIYSARILVRCDENGKLYLYDLVRTKKRNEQPA